MSNENIRFIATQALTEYLGVAAQFAVDDAIALLPGEIVSTQNQKLYETYFLFALSNALPPNVPFEKVKALIIRAL